MFKKILFCLFILFVVAYQSVLIYALTYGGVTFNQSLWQAFNIEQTPFSKFVYQTIELWWALPKICIILLVFAILKPNKYLWLITFSLSLLGLIALLWSTYSPSMLIDLR